MLDMDALEVLGIDGAEGLAYCADDPDFFEEMLAEYVKESEGNLAGLQQFYDRQDWGNYRILIHSVKNTSRMIGAAAVSDQAFLLETAAKEQETVAIHAAHGSFLAHYRDLTVRLQEMIG